MNIKKRNKNYEELDIMKIITVLHNANNTLTNKFESKIIQEVANTVIEEIEKLEDPTTEDVQRLLEDTLIQNSLTELAKAYIIGCYEKKFQKQSTELDESILSITNNSNEEISLENSNKDSALVTTQRDYIAGEVSKSIMRRLVLDKDVVDAHDKGLIHFHKDIVA